MDLFVSVLTHNVLANGRLDLLEQTRASLPLAFPDVSATIYDNGSTDGTRNVVEALRGTPEHNYHYGQAIHPAIGVRSTPGRGRNEIAAEIMSLDLPLDWIIVMSDDDILWRPGAQAQLEAFWSEAPDDVTIVSGLFEPQWAWNTPREVVRAGGVSVLIRDSAPAAAWTFRARHVDRIFPVLEAFGPGVKGEDLDACERLRAAGFRVGQLDLATHLGVGRSTHGNDPTQLGKPVDRKHWGLDP